MIQCALWNVRSLNNKLPDVMEHITDIDPEVVFLTETWLESDKNSVTAEAKTYGYKLLHNRRKDRAKEKGGGVGILVKTNINAKQLPVKHYTSFEHTIVKLPRKGGKFIFLISVYRLDSVATSTFLEEFTELLDIYTIPNEDCVIAGDMNIHLETDSTLSGKFKKMLDVYNLKQHVQEEATHNKGHTLDLVITPNIENYVNNVNVSNLDISDHFLIDFKVRWKSEERTTKKITYRSIRNVNMELFSSDVKERLDALTDANDVLTKVNDYNIAMAEVVEKHAPLKTRTVKVVPEVPWFDAEYAEQRKLRRTAEKKYRKSGLESDRKAYMALRKQTITLAITKKKSLISKKLQDGSAKTLYSVVNQLIDNNKRESVLPKSSSEKELADKFSVYFKEKVEKIRAAFKESSSHSDTKPYDGSLLSSFEPTTAEEVKEIISTHGIKCSPEDPVPANLLLPNIDVFVPYWVEMVNLSLELGDMEGMIRAIVIPLIKELSSIIETENFKNYRPVSNLLLISKIVERVVQRRLEAHMKKNGLQSNKNYGYMKNHSTELLLLKVVDDLFNSFDRKLPSVVHSVRPQCCV